MIGSYVAEWLEAGSQDGRENPRSEHHGIPARPAIFPPIHGGQTWTCGNVLPRLRAVPEQENNVSGFRPYPAVGIVDVDGALIVERWIFRSDGQTLFRMLRRQPSRFIRALFVGGEAK